MRLLNNFSITIKHIILILVMTAGLLLITTVSYEGMGTIKKRLDIVYFGNIVPATKLMTISQMYNKNILNTIHQYQNGLIDPKVARLNIQDANDVILDSWTEYASTYHTDEEQKVIDYADKKIAGTMDTISLLILLLDNNQKKEVSKIVVEELYPVIDPVTEMIQKLIAYEFSLAAEEKKIANVIYLDTKNILLASLAVILIVAIGIFIPIMRNIQKDDRTLRGLNDKLKHISITDPLTGIHNRRYFELIVRSELNRARRSHDSIAFAMIDIDFFKLYNDHYGHNAGDDALRAVAHALKLSLKRAGDFVFRLGGEEFAIFITGIGEEHAREFFENIRVAVKALDIDHEKNPKKTMTVSIGVSYLAHIEEQGLDGVMKCADASLYEAKDSGRDRVVFNAFDAERSKKPETLLPA